MPNWRDLSDEKLIEIAQDGVTEAFGEIYTRYVEQVYRFLNAHTADSQDAEDLTSDVFFRTWKCLPGYQQQGIPFYVLLFRIARNRLIDYYRRSKPERQPVSIDTVVMVDKSSDSGERALENIEHRDLRQALGKMREDYRVVLSLRFLSGLSPDEIAKVMDRSIGATRVLQHRALEALRRTIIAKEQDDDR